MRFSLAQRVTQYCQFNNRRSVLGFLLFCAIAFSQTAHAKKIPLPSDNCQKQVQINWQINPIFDETAPDTIWLHKLANWLHINTKQKALENEIAYLADKCQLTDDEIKELERYIRNLNYIRNAKVTEQPKQNGQQQLQVETWDTWSMMPTIDFGRKGGSNSFAIGIKDRNLLGLGIDSELEYFDNAQRSGYKVKINTPLYLKLNTKANFIFVDSDDGTQTSININKPFVSLDSKRAASAGFNNETRVDSIFQNGETINQFSHQINSASAWYGWSNGLNNNRVIRYLTGISKQYHHFTPVTSQVIPANRERLMPWVALEYIEDDFRKRENVYLINQIEDFNFGWDIFARIGVITNNDPSDASFDWYTKVSKGAQVSDNLLNLSQLTLEGTHYNGHSARWLANVKSELFYHLTPMWGLYAKADITLSDNQYLDTPVALGGDNGLRGFPLQYHHGDNSFLFSFETRFYPNIDIYKLFELGAVLFIDVGKVTGDSPFANNTDELMKSIGIGARFFSKHASDHNVIHLDIAHPITSDNQLSGIEVRIEMEHSF